MKLTDSRGRAAGFLYLLVVIVGFFQVIYVPNKLFVHNDATATAHNITTHETLFRLAMVSDLWSAVLMLFLTLALYQLFKGVDRRLAALMVILGGVIPAAGAFFDILNYAAALMLVQGNDFLSVFGKPQRDAWAMLFLHLDTQQMFAAEVFWGLWLFPLGILVYKSRLMPRFLGIWLIINGCAYLAASFVGFLLPQYESTLSNILFPLQLGEVAFMLWLLIMGIKQPKEPRSDFPEAPRVPA